jgi:hypothetical protein
LRLNPTTYPKGTNLDLTSKRFSIPRIRCSLNRIECVGVRRYCFICFPKFECSVRKPGSQFCHPFKAGLEAATWSSSLRVGEKLVVNQGLHAVFLSAITFATNVIVQRFQDWTRVVRVYPRTLYCSGGVLLLGATEWYFDAWNWIQDELDTKVYNATEARCYNVNLRTRGAFATIYHQDTYTIILKWIGAQLSSRLEPYDHVYQHLAGKCSMT